MKDKLNEIELNTTPVPIKIKEGHLTITLEDKDGNKEVVVDDHNMATNAIEEFLTNCGWLNDDNSPQDSLVQELLGGIMFFDDEIEEEDEDTITVPSGLNMTANGAIGTTNTGTPYELGSCSSISTETGWQSDGSFLMTFRWDENHGNGTHASCALTAKAMGLVGVGNPSGERLSGPRIDHTYSGNSTPYILGTWGTYSSLTAHVSIKDSEAYKIDCSDIGNGNITIKKYRIPTKTINLKGTTMNPVELDSKTITTNDSTLIEVLKSICNLSGGSEAYRYNYFDGYDHFWVWNSASSSDSVWGTNYTQYLWDIDVVNGTITTYTVLNTSGDELYAIYSPKFLGNTIAFINGWYYNGYQRGQDTSKIYQFTISEGVVGAITSISNTFGWGYADYLSGNAQYGASDDKVIIPVDNGGWICYDKAGTVYPINIYITSQSIERTYRTDCPLITYLNDYLSGSIYTSCAITLKRTMNYIATIKNFDTPYVKTPTQTMTAIYRLSFGEDDDNE